MILVIQLPKEAKKRGARKVRGGRVVYVVFRSTKGKATDSESQTDRETERDSLRRVHTNAKRKNTPKK